MTLVMVPYVAKEVGMALMNRACYRYGEYENSTSGARQNHGMAMFSAHPLGWGLFWRKGAGERQGYNVSKAVWEIQLKSYRTCKCESFMSYWTAIGPTGEGLSSSVVKGIVAG
jgi:hypothetical protein